MIERIEHDGPGGNERILELRLNRPPVNALSPELIGELRTAVQNAPREGARALVISGRPGMFSAGLDVPALLQLDRAGIRDTWEALYGALHALAESPIPVAAAITGHSPAGGAVLALYCDLRVMAEAGVDAHGAVDPKRDYRIGLNEVQVGLPMPPVIFRALAWTVGPHRASLLAGGGLLISAAEALRVGFVDELAPVDLVVERALAWCRHRLSLPPGAHTFTRDLGRVGLLSVFDGAERELDQLSDLWFEAETQGALRALVDRLKKK
jgi:3,2-trans-enoyl-CoA isomerase